MYKKISLEEAQNLLIKNVKKTDEMCINILKAHGEVLAETIVSPINQPPFDRSPLDGYALIAEDLENLSLNNPMKFKVIDEIYAGEVSSKKIEKGEAIRLMTGAPIPEGANCVIKHEDVIEKEDTIFISKQILPWQNYCFKGEDVKKGDRVLEKGRFLTSNEIGLIASLGIEKVKIYRKPNISILSTGDELIDIGEEHLPGKIYNSNIYSLAFRIKELNLNYKILGQVQDNVKLIKEKIKKHIEKTDMVITTGGVSAGKKDLMIDVLKDLGAEILFWGVEMKPGSSVLCGKYKGRLILCLSGNPAAGLIGFEVIARPMLAYASRQEAIKLKYCKGKITENYNKKSNVRRFLRGRMYLEEGKYYVFPISGNNSSGLLSENINCNCLIDIPKGSIGIKKYQEVDIAY